MEKDYEELYGRKFPKTGLKVWLRSWLDVEGPFTRYSWQDHVDNKFRALHDRITKLENPPRSSNNPE